MPEIEFTLRLNTPAFVGSVADGTKTVRAWNKKRRLFETSEVKYVPVDPAGIRAPSLRGILAYWYRSLFPRASPEELFRAQEKVFGSTGAGQGLKIRTVDIPEFKSRKLCFEHDLYPLLYLGYGPLQLLRPPLPGDGPVPPGSHPPQRLSSYNTSVCRDAIHVQGDPAFTFAAHGTDSQIAALKASLLLLHLFGGIGSRSRRGWGSVHVVAGCIPAPKISGSRVEEFPDYYDRLCRTAVEHAADLPSHLPLFSALSRKAAIRRSKVGFETWREALDDFYLRFSRTRSLNRSSSRAPAPLAQIDHDLEAREARPGAPLTQAPKRMVFGMPYYPRSQSGNWGIEYHRVRQDPETGELESLGTRRASPLFLKVFRFRRRYFPVALALKAQFFGDSSHQIGAKVKDADDLKPQTSPPPDYTAIDAFMTTFAL